MHAWLRPFYSMGLVFRVQDGASYTFLGSCFAYSSRSHFLAAAHCIRGLTPSQLEIVPPVVDHPSLAHVRAIKCHPTADLAMIETEADLSDEVQPFRGVSAHFGWGERVLALGYPEEAQRDGVLPTARLFTGTIQRELIHDSHMGYKYQAGELSFGSPAGLSGGPVFPASEHDLVLGVVAENHDSTTFLRSVAEIQDGSRYYTEKVHEVIRYGLFVRLDMVKEWLDSNSSSSC